MGLVSALRALMQRRRVARELDDELRFHVEMETEANIARGMPPDQARRQAIEDFGGFSRTREAVLDVRTLVFDALWQDLRSAARTLAAARSFAISAAATLALGVGIATAMFTVIDSLVLRPVPFHEPDQLASISTRFDARGPAPRLSPGVVDAWRASPAFESVELARRQEALLELDGTVAVGDVGFVTPGIFDLLGGIRPLSGRLFTRDGSAAGEAVISESLWRRQFGAAPSILGRTIEVDGESLTVVGILPGDVTFPGTDTAVWRTVESAAGFENFNSAYVRFASDLPRDDALRIAIEAAAAVDPAFTAKEPSVSPIAAGLRDEYSTRAAVFLAAGVVLVFLTLCANVCGLMLARLTARRGDFGVRAVLGAERGRLVRQAFAESAMLGIGGIVLGTGVAWLCIVLARALIPPSLFAQTLNALNLDARALAVTSIVGLVAILATGLLPALLASRVDVAGSLRGLDARRTEVRGARLLGRGLLVAEVALACLLLVGATLLTRSFFNLSSVDRGLDPSGVTTLWLSMVDSVDGDDAGAVAAMFAAIEQELRAIPGARELAWSGAAAVPSTGRAAAGRVRLHHCAPFWLYCWNMGLLK
ncbi:MAG: ABC transporter permease [Gammaproteobacteria bacterium]